MMVEVMVIVIPWERADNEAEKGGGSASQRERENGSSIMSKEEDQRDGRIHR